MKVKYLSSGFEPWVAKFIESRRMNSEQFIEMIRQNLKMQKLCRLRRAYIVVMDMNAKEDTTNLVAIINDGIVDIINDYTGEVYVKLK